MRDGLIPSTRAVEADAELERAAVRMRHLKSPNGIPLRPILGLAEVKLRQAEADGLVVPAAAR